MAVVMADPKKKTPNKGGRPKGERPPKGLIGPFRGSAEYRGWIEGLIKHCRKQTGWHSITLADVVRRGLVLLAKEVGYEPEPPNGD